MRKRQPPKHALYCQWDLELWKAFKAKCIERGLPPTRLLFAFAKAYINDKYGKRLLKTVEEDAVPPDKRRYGRGWSRELVDKVTENRERIAGDRESGASLLENVFMFFWWAFVAIVFLSLVIEWI